MRAAVERAAALVRKTSDHVLYAAFASRVPDIKHELGLTAGELRQLGGAVADRMDRKRLLIGSEALMALCLAGLLLNALTPLKLKVVTGFNGADDNDKQC